MWKLKVDAEGKPVLDANGNYIFLKPDGTDFVADMAQIVGKIAELTNEAKTHRTRADTAEASLAAFKDIDPAKAKAALQTVKDIKDGDLINKGKLDEVRAEITAALQGQIGEKDTKITDLSGRLKNTLLSNAFAQSGFVKDKLILSPDLVQSSFGAHFDVDVDKGTITAKKKSGDPVYSKKNPGANADFEEALEILISEHPSKATILKGANNGGGGGGNGGAGDGGKRVITRAEFDKLTPADAAKAAADARAGTVQLTD